MSTGADIQKRINYLGVSMERFKEKIDGLWIVTMSDGTKARIKTNEPMTLWRKVVDNKMFPCIAQQIKGWKPDCGEQAMTVGFNERGNMDNHEVVERLMKDGVKQILGLSELDLPI